MAKPEIRRNYTTRRAKLSLLDVESLSLQIANNALKLPIWDKTYYHIYLSILNKKEVNTEFLLHILQGKDKSIIIPKTNFHTNTLTHILLEEHTKIELSSLGIPEPMSGLVVEPQLLDVVFVPLLAYDLSGNRIGYGKGFYDRFLSQCTSQAIFVGLSFFDPEPKLAFGELDIPLHFCVTPRETFAFTR